MVGEPEADAAEVDAAADEPVGSAGSRESSGAGGTAEMKSEAGSSSVFIVLVPVRELRIVDQDPDNGRQTAEVTGQGATEVRCVIRVLWSVLWAMGCGRAVIRYVQGSRRLGVVA